MITYAQGRELFAQDLYGGADQTHRLPVRVVTEFAWHSLFIQHLLIERSSGDRDDFSPELTIIDLPGFQADPAVSWFAIGYSRGQFHPQTRADRRHVLCGRDEEIRLHHPELSAPAQARHADALLGECRQERR
jgi:hypothetical protein